jgi:hypothetical protein
MAASIYDAHVLSFGDCTNIRVIEILHNDTTDPQPLISCKLHVVSLDDTPAYRALSYVWGDEAVTRTILVDGYRFNVRKNLFDFLAQYRSNDEGGYLWIDALCIDQSNVQERNHQVALMGIVYSKAAMVIAWLGSSSEQASAIDALNHCKSLSDLQLATSLYLLCANQYWSRIWIVQEFVLCRKLELWSENARVDGQVFCELFSLRLDVTKSKVTDPEISRKLDLCYWSNARTVAIYRARNKRMGGFVDDFISCECSDRRDRIYGLLGVLNAKQKADFPIQPDYSKPATQLFLETWIMWLTSILNEPTSELEATWWLEVHRYATRLKKRLQLTKWMDGTISEMVINDVLEKKKQDPEIDRPWNERIQIEHVQALLIFANDKLKQVEKSPFQARGTFYGFGGKSATD